MPDGPTSLPESSFADETSRQIQVANGSVHENRPPDLPHITERFIPISHVALVLARNGYSELSRLRQDGRDLPDQKRKKRVVDYAAKYRAEVIKLLVLIGWASRAAEVSTAIDVRAWLQGQKNCYENLYRSLRYHVLRNLESAKIVGPDIPTAIDVLTSKSLPALQKSDLAKVFQIKESLGIPQILGTLRNLDTLISLRLLLHEVLPSVMQTYVVGSGRATFKVSNEFTVDLFFASEEVESPTLQWFMIDFCFAFTAGDAIDTPLSLKLELETISNALLARTLAQGPGKHQLVELYNFLHSFTIQYKLERLFSQFSSIGSREKGRIDIKYASAQKVLAVGFWLSKRHPIKNTVLNSLTVTIEAPEASSKERSFSSIRTTHDFNREKLRVVVRFGEREQPIGEIAIEEHSAASLLSAIVQSRVQLLLREVEVNLLGAFMPFTNSSSEIKSETLCVRLLRDEILLVAIDEYDGTYLLSLQTTTSEAEPCLPHPEVKELQSTLNMLHNPRDVAKYVYDFKVNYIKREIESLASTAGWDSIHFPSSTLTPGDFASAFHTPGEKSPITPASCLFLTRSGEDWMITNSDKGSSWFVVVDLQANVSHFWLAEMEVIDRASKWQIQWRQKLLSGTIGGDQAPTSDLLDVELFDRLWRLSTARIITLRVSRNFGEHGIAHVFVRHRRDNGWTSLSVPDIVLPTEDIAGSKVNWAGPLLTLCIPSICRDNLGTSLVTVSCDRESLPGLDLSTCEDAVIRIKNAEIVFEIGARVSHAALPVFEQFHDRWRLLQTTVDLVNSANKLPQFFLQSVTLASATFAYGEKEAYIVQIQQQATSLNSARQLSVTLGSIAAKHNPHIRITQYLSSVATRFQSNMTNFFRVLMLTQPVLETLNRIEQENFSNPECYVTVRSIGTYRLYYPRKSVALLLRARPAPKIAQLPEPYKKLANTTVWHFTDASKSSTPIPGQVVIDSCQSFFNAGLNDALQTDLTFPEGSGIGCAPELASEVLSVLHKTIIEQQAVPGAARPETASNNTTKMEKLKARTELVDGSKSSRTTVSKKNEKANARKPRPLTADGSNGHRQNTNEVIEIL